MHRAKTVVEVGLATSRDDLDGAFRLVHDRYVAQGYMRPDPSGRRLCAHHALPATRVFVARAAGRVIGTLSLIPDSFLEMPCDALYHDELTAMRAAGRRLAEVATLAVADLGHRDGMRVVRSLIQMVAVYARHLARVDDLCITVSTRHAKFYEALLRFERFGRIRPYAAVNHTPAVGLRLDLAHNLAAPPAPDELPFAAALFTPAEIERVLTRLRVDVARSSVGAADVAALLMSAGSRDAAVAGDRLQFFHSPAVARGLRSRVTAEV